MLPGRGCGRPVRGPLTRQKLMQRYKSTCGARCTIICIQRSAWPGTCCKKLSGKLPCATPCLASNCPCMQTLREWPDIIHKRVHHKYVLCMASSHRVCLSVHVCATSTGFCANAVVAEALPRSCSVGKASAKPARRMLPGCGASARCSQKNVQ